MDIVSEGIHPSVFSAEFPQFSDSHGVIYEKDFPSFLTNYFCEPDDLLVICFLGYSYQVHNVDFIPIIIVALMENHILLFAKWYIITSQNNFSSSMLVLC